MKILNFEEYVNERLFKSSIDRISSGEIRKEEGAKVKTSFGNEIIIRNLDCPYDKIIESIFDYKEDSFELTFLGNFENQQEIIKGESKTTFLLSHDKRWGLCISFQDYEDITHEYNIVDDTECDEIDYYSIIKGIAEYLKENVDIEKVKGGIYSEDFALLLIDENATYDAFYELDDNYDTDFIWDDFKEFVTNEYPDVEFKYWSYNNYGTNIGLEISYQAVLDYKKIKESVESFFENLKETYQPVEDDE